MKQHQLGAAIVICFCMTSLTWAGTQAKTTFTFSEPITFGAPLNRTFDAFVLDWSTPLSSGLVFESDLSDMTFRLLNGGATLYTDQVIQAGIVQPIGGVPRDIIGLSFFFDLDDFPSGVLAWDNDVDVVQEDAAVGETYNIYGLALFNIPELTIASVDGYSDGEFQDFWEPDFTQSTVVIPEPATICSAVCCARLLALAGGNDANRLERRWAG